MAIPGSPITLGSLEKTGLEGDPGASRSLIPSPLTGPLPPPEEDYPAWGWASVRAGLLSDTLLAPLVARQH